VKVLFLIGRIVFGGFFLTSGFFDLRHYRFFVPLVAASGVPFPRFAVVFALLLILVGGISVVLGLWPRGGLCLIILFLILVTPIAHAFWARSDRGQHAADLNDFMKNSALLGASVMMLVIPQPWPYSVDGAAQMRKRQRQIKT
jgi:putative oxidoreductase